MSTISQVLVLLVLSVALLVAVSEGNTLRTKRGADQDHGEHGHRDGGKDKHRDRSRDRDRDQDQTQDQDEEAPMPEDIQMDIPMEDSVISKLELKRSYIMNASLPVFVGTGRHSFVQMDMRGKDDFAVYQDSSKNASFVMWNSAARKNSRRPRTGMLGVFNFDGESYSMEPVSMRQRRGNGQGPPAKIFTVHNMEFAMTKVDKSDMSINEQEQSITQSVEATMERVKQYVTERQQQGTYPNQGANPLPGNQPLRYEYEVESFVVADYSMFKKFLEFSTAPDYETREAEAIDDLRFYFAHIMNGVAMRYESVNDPADFRIHVIPVGIFIAKTVEASFWTESYTVKESFVFTQAYGALDLFEAWINDEQANLPPFDQASLFSANFLFSGYYNNGRRRTINGLATITGICRYGRASLNYDQGQYGTIQNAAHEMGHNLGAYHDGSNNECSSVDQYIMAVSPGNLDSRNFDNTFEFSPCSQRAFYDYLLYISDQNTNCLIERQNYESNWDYENYLPTLAGQRYTADEQCKLVYGPQSAYCGGGDRDQGICSRMDCWLPNEFRCYSHVEQRAADGTQCGHQQWCINGRCEFDSRAPTAELPECIYGDYVGVVDERNNYRCEDLPSLARHSCYDDVYRAKCCATCENIRDKDNPTCEFGDEFPDYCLTINDRDCYEQSVRDQCCETCRNKRRDDKVGCEYGDRAFYSCQDALSTPRYCYTLTDTCCESCPSLSSGVEGCEWGDQNSWCEGIEKRLCYRSDYSKGCCNTCQPTGPRGCEFGDRETNCASRNCNTDPDAQRDCCQTCGNPTPEPPTPKPTTPASTTPAPETPAPPVNTCPTQDRSECSYRVTTSRDCYNHADICCNKCNAEFLTSDANCMFGDRYSWCEEYVTRNKGRVCFGNDMYVTQGCCQVCARYNAPTTPAPVGPGNCYDDADWCSVISSGACYDPQTERVCCAKCAGFKRPSSACQYGDMYSWCALQYCDRNGDECCETCRDFN